MFLFRWLSGLPIAAAITLGLFYMMSQLIKDRGFDPGDPVAPREITITRQIGDSPAGERPRPPRPIPEKIPETPIELPGPTDRPTSTGPRPEIVNPGKTQPDGTGVLSGAIIKIAPPYPEGCRSRNAQGVVIVEFDVTPEGNVVNPRIVESADSCFNRTVLKSVSGWKYPPASGGMRYSVIERFNFQLVD